MESPFDPILTPSFLGKDASLVLIFGLREHLEDPTLLDNLTETFPKAKIVGCSTAGEIFDGNFKSESIVGLAIKMRQSRCEVVSKSSSPEDNFVLLGKEIATTLDAEDLKLVLLFPEGINVDCDELLVGIQGGFEQSSPLIFGGLAGDSLDFNETILYTNDGAKDSGIIAVGFYGSGLEVKSSITNQYSKVGPLHRVTKCDGNRLFEVDGLPALDVLLDEIGPEFDTESPALTSMVDFPIVFENEEGVALYARTPMYVDENERSLLYAGSLNDRNFRFSDLRANQDFLDGARKAAQEASMDQKEDWALVVSCAARRIALGVAVDQELSQISPGLNSNTPVIGFYAYGEIGFCKGTGKAEIFNHSLNVITVREI